MYPAFCKLGNASGSTGVIQEAVANNREEVKEEEKLKKEREKAWARRLVKSY